MSQSNIFHFSLTKLASTQYGKMDIFTKHGCIVQGFQKELKVCCSKVVIIFMKYTAIQTIYKCAIATIHQPITFKADEEKIVVVVLWQNLVILNASMHLLF